MSTSHEYEQGRTPGSDPETNPGATAAAKAGEIIGDVGVGAARSAVQGAAVGGVAGAAAGAVKGAVGGALRNKTVRRWVIAAVAAVLVLTIGAGATVTAAAVNLITTLVGVDDQDSTYAIGEDQIDSARVREAAEVAQRFSIARELAIAILEANESFDFPTFAAHLDEHDPARQLRDLRTGSLMNSTTVARYIPADGVYADAADAVRKLHVDAMVAAGFASTTAGNVYSRALNWALGESTDAEQAACFAPAAGTPDGEEMVIAGTRWTSGQVANMRTTIGVAKTMFPDAARKAAIIGLITVRQESTFNNYANDGVFTSSKDPNPGRFGPADYKHLAFSLTLPHDAVGSDHASVGIMQQQATMGWGDYRGSTWAAGDYEEVITRLMNPAFAVGKFYVRVESIDGWQDLHPGKVAQRVQVSAYPAAYNRHVAFANEAWGLLSASSPALAVPAETGWTGGTFDDTAMPVSSGCPGSPVLIDGEYTWPVETDADGSMAGYLTSGFGNRILNGAPNFHSGIDITGAGYGTGVYAITGGTVVKSNLWSPECGEYIQIAHPDGTGTGYLHMIDRLVNVGDTVTPGQLIAHVGGSQPGGCTFGAHLHLYAFDTDGARVDPVPYLAARGMVIPPARNLTD